MIHSPIKIGEKAFPNRVLLQPMEGFSCEEDGSPTPLITEKYLHAAESGAGCIWFEANAVCPEGRSNLHQMMLTEKNLPLFCDLVQRVLDAALASCGTMPILILQLTHSGRQSITPMIAYRHPIYEARRPMDDTHIVTDEYLDTLPRAYAESARLAMLAGFDGVDVKSCHGYLLQELLSAFTREGRYGGSFENRTRLYLSCIDAVREALPKSALLTSRLSISDMVQKPYGFGTDEAGAPDMTEPDRLIGLLQEKGVRLLNVTLGNPYYNPHVNRPYRQGGYTPPETADVGLARFEAVEAHLKARFPSLAIAASGLSYYGGALFMQCERLLTEGVCDLVGVGRMWLAYPRFYRDYKDECFNPKKCCLTCSKCTELMRAHEVSGCAVFNPYYRSIYRRLPKAHD